MDDRLVALGLYRLRGATDNEYSYVYTNPHYETIVTHRDKIFVLGVEIPDYLESEVYQPLDHNKEKNFEGGVNQRRNSHLQLRKKKKGTQSTNNHFYGI